eukprot:8325235-Alexandrium_andersonii.AAC.1
MSVLFGTGVASGARVVFSGVGAVFLSPGCVPVCGCSMSAWGVGACLLVAPVSAEDRFAAASAARARAGQTGRVE